MGCWECEMTGGLDCEGYWDGMIVQGWVGGRLVRGLQRMAPEEVNGCVLKGRGW